MKSLPALTVLLSVPLLAQEKITYDDHVFPIFEQSCLNCHNPDKKKGDLDLSSYPALMVGSSGGKVAIPGDGASSKLYTVCTGTEEPVMPPEGDKIDKKAADLIRAWIDGGMLETKDSSARKSSKPKFDLAVDPSAGKPEGPPPMPAPLSLDPSFVAPQAGLVKSMTASPWAPLVALTGQKQILLYHSETFRFLGSFPFPKGQPESLSFHPSGKYLIAAGGIAGKSGQTIAWDVTTGKELFTAGREFDSVLAAAITPDLATVAMGGPSRLVKIWNTRENQQSASIKKHTDWVTAMASSPNGKFFASGDRNGGIHVWDINGNEIHALRDHQGGVTALAFRSDSKLLASTGEDGQLIIWDMKKGSPAKKVKAHDGGATALHYHRDGHIATAGRDRVVKIYKPDFNEKTSFKNLPEIITAAALSQDGKHLFTADYNGEVFVYDVSSNKSPIAHLESNPPTLANRLSFLKKQISDLSGKVASTKKVYQARAKDHNALKERINGTKKALQKNENTVNKLTNQIKSSDNQLNELGKKQEQVKKNLSQARSEKEKALKQEKDIQTQVEKLAQQNKEDSPLSKKRAESQKKRSAAAKRENELKAQSDKFNQERSELAGKQKTFRKQQKELRELIKTGKQSLQNLEKKLPPVTKSLQEPKKALDQALAAEKKALDELSYWQSQK